MRRRRESPVCVSCALPAALALATALGAAAVPAGAQVATAPVDVSEPSTSQHRYLSGYLTASYGIARASEDSYAWAWTIPVNEGGGRSESRTTYNLPEGETFSVGGGVLVGTWGAGLLATEQSHSDAADKFEFFSTSTFPEGFLGTGATSFELERRERAVHLQALWAPRLTETLQAMVFAGPSYFYDVSQETIDFIAIELLEPGLLRPVPFPPSTQEESALGYHAGGDLTLYLTGRIGVGLSALYSHATVEFRDRYAEEMLTNVDVVTREQDIGGLQLAVGLRVRL